MRFVALDFETTGVVRGLPSEPWQLGVVEVVDGVPRAETKWETLFHIPGATPVEMGIPPIVMGRRIHDFRT